MPIHDWTRVEAGDYHDFHQDWTIQIRRALNAGLLPPGYYAQADRRVVGGYEPDVATFHRPNPPTRPGGVAVAVAPPRVRQSARAETDREAYTRKANRVAVRDADKRLVALIEVVSPGNKDSRHALRSFVTKAVEFLQAGVHLMVVDLFPPTPRDPDGIHHALWDELVGEPFEARPADKPLTAAAYATGDGLTAYVEPLAVGDRLPDLPLFLSPGYYVPTPLEATYQSSWDVLPEPVRGQVAPPPS